MKRFLLFAVAVIFTAIFISPSFAVEVSFDGTYQIRAISLENSQDFNNDNSKDRSYVGTSSMAGCLAGSAGCSAGNANKDQDAWIDQQFRLGITMKDAPVTGYVQIDMSGSGPDTSYVWGTGTGTGEGAGLRVSARLAYLEFPAGPFQLKIGRTYESHGFLGGGIFENVADRYVVAYAVNPAMAISFVHTKASEGTADTYRTSTSGTASGVNDDDRNIYDITFTYKPENAPFDASVGFYYTRDGANYYSQTGASTAGGDWDAYWLTAQTNIRLNPVNIYLSAAYVDGESNRAAGTGITAASYDIRAYALHADINAAFGPVKLGIMGGIGSGDDNTTDTNLETFFAPGSASYNHSHIFWQAGENNYHVNPMISSDISSNLNLQNGSRETLSNITWVGIYGEYKATDDLTFGAEAAHFEKTESLDNTEDSIGNEYNLTANYKIHKGLSLFAFAGWFDPDDGMICGATNVSTASCINGTVANHNADIVSAYFARLLWEF